MRDLLLHQFNERRALRAFATEAPDLEQQEALWEAARAAPSHGNAQPVRLLIARSESVRAGVRAALSPGNQQWAAVAPLLVGLAVLPGHETVRNYGEERALSSLHAGIALGNMMVQATTMGLVAHPLAGFDETAVREAFAAPDELRVLALVAIGAPGAPATLPPDLAAREGNDPGRLPLDVLLVEDQWRPENGQRAADSRRR